MNFQPFYFGIAKTNVSRLTQHLHIRQHFQKTNTTQDFVSIIGISYLLQFLSKKFREKNIESATVSWDFEISGTETLGCVKCYPTYFKFHQICGRRTELWNSFPLFHFPRQGTFFRQCFRMEFRFFFFPLFRFFRTRNSFGNIGRQSEMGMKTPTKCTNSMHLFCRTSSWAFSFSPKKPHSLIVKKEDFFLSFYMPRISDTCCSRLHFGFC